jgi:hypothetical protein
VARAFSHGPVLKWEKESLLELNEDVFEAVLEEIHEAKGWDAHRKVRAYVQAALTWARKYRRKESGLIAGLPPPFPPRFNGQCPPSPAADIQRSRIRVAACP